MKLKLYPTTRAGLYRALFLLFFAMVFSMYANSLGNDFVFDDVSLIVENESLRSFRNLADFVPTARKTSGYRPVRFFSYLIDYQLFGLNSIGFRMSNILYHTINTFLVFLLARMLGLSVFGAFFSSLVFLAHPLQTESVAYISGRRDLLFTLFYLSGLVFFSSNYQRLTMGRLTKGRSMTLVVLMVLAIFSKEMAASFPLMIVWLAFWLELNGKDRDKSSTISPASLKTAALQVWRKSAIFITMIFSLGGLFVLYKLFYWRPTAQQFYWGGSVLNNFLTVAKVWVYYIGLLLVPVPLKGDYSIAAFPIVYDSTEVLAWICLLLIVAFLAVSLLLIRRRPVISFSCIWFGISLLPVSHIIPHHELMAEHYLYLPLVGFSLCIGWLLSRLFDRGHVRKTYIIFTMIICLYGSRTMVRNLDWQTSFHFWKSAVRFEPVAARACLNVGVLYDQMGNETEFLHYMQRSIEIKPSARALYNMAVYWQEKGEREKAIILYKQAMELDLNFAQPFFNLGFLYKEMGENELALRTFAAFHDFASSSDLQFASGVTSFDQGNMENALVFFSKARQQDPLYSGVNYYLGRCYEKRGDCRTAIKHFRTEIEHKSKFSAISHSHYHDCLNRPS